jgi:hypothetical protein
MNFKLLLLVAVVPTVLAAPVVANTITTQTRSFSLATLDDAPINGQTRNFANFNSFGLTGQTLTSVTLTAVYNINGRVVATNNATGGTAASRRRDVSASYELNATTTGEGFSLSGSNLASQTITGISGQGNDRTLNLLNPTFTLTQTLTSNLSGFLTGPVQISTDAFAVFASVPAADVVYGAPSITGGQAEFTLIYTAVPEPTTWAMLITGVGIAGATMRRRRVTAAVA